MTISRRDFINVGAIAAALAVSNRYAVAAERPRIRAVAFDAFPIFDPRPIFALAERLFPGNGKALGVAWRTRQFEYQWLRALGGQYVDFWHATRDGLTFAADQLALNMDEEKKKQLMDAYLQLKAWPDVAAGLAALKRSGIRLTFLSNMTPMMLHANLRNAGLASYFDHVISTDTAKTYKPDPRAYQLGEEVLGLPRQQIAFAAFAGWDVAGAKWFGYPTVWVNRAGLKPEVLGAAPDATGKGMRELISFVGAQG